VSIGLNLIRSIIRIKPASKIAKDLTNISSLRVKLLVLLLDIKVKLLLVLNILPLIAR
jgi:hypothetical protein